MKNADKGLNTIEIRPLILDDYDLVYHLWTQTAGMGMRTLDDSKEGIAKFIQRNPTTSFVAIYKQEIIGVILAGHDGRRGYIYHAAVKETMRGNGLGKQLLDTATQALINEGIHKVALVVFEHNTIGNRFWEKEGFAAREDLVYRNRSLNEGNL